MKKGLSVGIVAITWVLMGCGQNDAAKASADALLGAIFESKTSSPQELAMLKAMPEYGQAIDCLANHLDMSGWTMEDHNFFMAETRNTGNMQYLDSRKFTEAEQIEHFGPLLTSPCL